MAALSQGPKSKTFRILFYFGGKQYHKSLKTTDRAAAEAKRGHIEEMLTAMEKGWVDVPPPDNFWPYLFSGGKLDAKPSLPTVLTLDQLFARYEQEMPPGTMEANSLGTGKLHRKHLLRLLGAKTDAQAATTTELQRYVNERSREKYRGKPLSPTTIRKEVASFRVVWNWGKLHGLVTRDAPTKGLRYEKGEEKIEFLTWEEIEKRIARGGQTPGQVTKLWDALFLTPKQIEELLGHAKGAAGYPFIYPMLVFVAHTGARRSEMMRARVEDFDFTSGAVTIREKKKDKTVKETHRHVQMTTVLKETMQNWLTNGHPGGPYMFCHGDHVTRSKKRSKTTGHQNEKVRPTGLKDRLKTVHERTERPEMEPLTKKEATYHFKQTLAGSKWAVVKGFHVFRHSFASNMAAANIRL